MSFGNGNPAAQKGAALILVLWTFAVLSALAAEFARAMRQEAESTRSFKQEMIGHYTAVAGLNETILAIETYNGELDYVSEDGESLDRHARSRRKKAENELAAGEDGLDDVRTLLNGRGEWVEATFNGAKYEVRAIDEEGRIPLNAVDDDVEGGLSERTDDQQVIDVSACMEVLGIRASRSGQNRPTLRLATLEARVKDPGTSERVAAQVAVSMKFRGQADGFQVIQWYDSVFDE